jgi:hypothetical protein
MVMGPSWGVNRQLAELFCKSVVDIFVMAIMIIYGSMSASGQCFKNAGSRTVKVKSLPL